MKVAILMGSDSDFPVVERCINILKKFDVTVEARVLSAHRTPHLAIEYALNAEANGVEVISFPTLRTIHSNLSASYQKKGIINSKGL